MRRTYPMATERSSSPLPRRKSSPSHIKQDATEVKTPPPIPPRDDQFHVNPESCHPSKMLATYDDDTGTCFNSTTNSINSSSSSGRDKLAGSSGPVTVPGIGSIAPAYGMPPSRDSGDSAFSLRESNARSSRSMEMVYEDIDSDDEEMRSLGSLTLTTVRKPAVNARPLSVAMKRSLNLLLLGHSRKQLSKSWLQGFVFTRRATSPKVSYGLVQFNGGPCGLLAVVQAMLIVKCLFGMDNDDDDGDGDDDVGKGQHDRTTGTRRIDTSGKEAMEVHDMLCQLTSDDINSALARTLAEIIWRARKNDTAPALVARCVSGAKGTMIIDRLQTIECRSKADLCNTITERMGTFKGELGIVLFLCSVALTRTVECVISDMDSDAGNCLIGAHSYCTQEMVNLLLVGKATSNVHDGNITLDGGAGEADMILKGIMAPSNVGFLSLFEHYKSMEVGKYLKEPKYPVWVVCSESHFSVLFGANMHIVKGHTRKLDLFYYDTLANQDDYIRLTLSVPPPSNSSMEGGCDGDGDRVAAAATQVYSDDLVPPLDHCIRTRWPNATISWNHTEPLL